MYVGLAIGHIQHKRDANKPVGQRTRTAYVEGVSERVHRIAKRTHTNLRRLILHAKDQVELAEQGELVYQIPCKNCGAEYIGETGKLLKIRLD